MEWLNYHHLRYFWTVAKEGSLKQAAEKLRVSQPSISAQVSELEEVFGEKLFRRRGRSKVLNDAGQVAYRYANEIFTLGRDDRSLPRAIPRHHRRASDCPSRLCPDYRTGPQPPFR